MVRLQALHQNFKIRHRVDHPGIKHAQSQIRSAWRRLNSSDFIDSPSRRSLLNMVDPANNPFLANYVITTLRSIHTQTDLSLSEILPKHFEYADGVVQEMAFHRIATTGSVPDFIDAIFRTCGYVREEHLSLYQAVTQHQYHPNPAWLERIHNFTHRLLSDIARKVAAQYHTVSTQEKKWIESALVAAAIVASQTTFDQVMHSIQYLSSGLADRIKRDRDSFLNKRYAYHFVEEKLLEPIVKEGLSAKFAPEGSERPDVLCFNNEHYAGVEYLLLGIAGFYVNNFLLRVPLDAAPFQPGKRDPHQDLGDYTADYLLDREHVIPPEKVEIVDPVIATRAMPLLGV